MSRNLRIIMIAVLYGFVCGNSVFGCPFKVSANRLQLVDCQGIPQTFNGSSSWHMFARLTREETIDYLDDLSGRGINTLLVQLMVADSGTGNTRNAYGDKPFLTPGDFSTPNEAYFTHVDWAITASLDRGFTLMIAPAYLGYNCGNQGWCQEMITAGDAEMGAWGKWVGARYKDFERIIWVHGGDADADAWGALEIVNALANGIRSVDTVHLHTAHCNRNNSADDCYDQPWLDINTTYGECSSTSQQLYSTYTSSLRRPNIYIEGRYEFHSRWTSQCIKGQAYAAALGGAIGHIFGSELIWNFQSNWREGLGSRGFEAIAHFGALLGARNWPDLVPDYDHLIVKEGYESITSEKYVSAALGVGHKTALVYLPTQHAVTVSLDAIAGHTVEATWFDPTTGTGFAAGVFPSIGDKEFRSPSDQDWVLVLDDQATDWQDIWLEHKPEIQAMDLQIRLFSPEPNPLNLAFQIAFMAPKSTKARVLIYDVVGRQIDKLFEGNATGGLQGVTWQAGNRPQGVYFARLSVADQSTIQRILLVR